MDRQIDRLLHDVRLHIFGTNDSKGAQQAKEGA